MIFSSLGEVFEHMDEVRGQLNERVSALDENSHTRRASEAAWCVADLVEHLSVTEPFVTVVIEKLLTASEEIGAAPPPGGSFPAPVKFPSVVRRPDAYKAVAPERIRPRGGVPVAESMAKLAASRAHLKSLRPRMEAVDLSQATHPHPMIKELTLPQWLVFISEHEARHLTQLDEILAGQANGE